MRESLQLLGPALGFASIGFFYGIAIIFTIIPFGGLGHGWGGLFPSIGSIVAAPLLGFAFGYRNHKFGIAFTALALLGILGIDALIFVACLDGFRFSSFPFRRLPFALLWLCLFSTLHIVAWKTLRTTITYQREHLQKTPPPPLPET